MGRKVSYVKGAKGVTKPTVQIAGTEGNIYALIGKVSAVLRGSGLFDREDEFVLRAVSLATYDEVLRLSQDYVEFGDENEQSTE